MRKQKMCLPHAANSVNNIFAGQKILITSKPHEPGVIELCEYKNTNVGNFTCKGIAAVEVRIFDPREPIQT